MFKWVFGIILILLTVIAMFPVTAQWGKAVKDYFVNTFKNSE